MEIRYNLVQSIESKSSQIEFNQQTSRRKTTKHTPDSGMGIRNPCKNYGDDAFQLWEQIVTRALNDYAYNEQCCSASAPIILLIL